MKRTKVIVAWIFNSLTIRNRSDAKIIAMCFLAATTFWFLNALNKSYSTRLAYPIRFEYDDSIYVAVSPLPKRVRINASGYGWNLLRKSLLLNSNALNYRVPNPLQTKYITGSTLLPSITDQLRDITVNYVVEDTIYFDFDRITTKQVRLLADSAGIDLASSFRITSPISIQPSTINFKGPSSLLKAIPDTIILGVTDTDIDENYRENLTINYVQSSLISSNANTAQVSFDVAPFVKQTMQMPIQLVNVPEKDSVVLVNPLLPVSYWVKRDDAAKVQPDQFKWIADYKRFNKSDSTVQVILERKPEYVSEVTLPTTSVKVTYVK